LGEAFVIAFFGVGAVMGTHWLVAATLSGAAFASGVALGLFAAAVLLTNNQREAVTDARSGRRTLAILLGPQRSRHLYAVMVLIPFVLLPIIDLSIPHGHAWLAFLALPFAVQLARGFGSTSGIGFNRILARTALIQIVFGTLLCLGLAV
jgi:1,4-dihydroxy-2-naphthoate octaprenyltransferase